MRAISELLDDQGLPKAECYRSRQIEPADRRAAMPASAIATRFLWELGADVPGLTRGDRAHHEYCLNLRAAALDYEDPFPYSK